MMNSILSFKFFENLLFFSIIYFNYGIFMIQEKNSLRCFLRNANHTIGYLYASKVKDPSSFDRMICTHHLDDVPDTDVI